MKTRIFTFLFLFLFNLIQAQELNCTVTVNANKIVATNKQVFKTLERSLTDFVNKTVWTSILFTVNEKINCSMFIDLNSVEGDVYSASIQVQSSRPVFGSTYSSPVFNHNDKEFKFSYSEFQNLTYNPSSFDSNLVSVVSFYSLIIIGLDADTFSLNGGTNTLEIAREVANVAQTSGFDGWIQSKSTNNRYFLINDLLSTTFAPYRDAMFQYNYQGMDLMAKDLKASKNKIIEAIATLKQLHSNRPNAFLTRVFFDAKTDEIVSIFTGGPSVSITGLVDDLNKISSLNSSKWSSLKF